MQRLICKLLSPGFDLKGKQDHCQLQRLQQQFWGLFYFIFILFGGREQGGVFLLLFFLYPSFLACLSRDAPVEYHVYTYRVCMYNLRKW